MLDLEVAPEELKTMMSSGGPLLLLDVREPWETGISGFPGAVRMPMGQVPGRAYNELDPEGRIVVICHHGVRSLNVANWLRNQGYDRAQSLRGGIDAWSREVDSTLPRY